MGFHIVYGNDYVACLNAGSHGGSAVNNLADKKPVVDNCYVMLLFQFGSQLLIGYAENRALNSAVLLDVGHYFGDNGCRYGKRIARIVAGLGVYGCVYAHQLAGKVDKRAAGIARIYRSVGLYVRFYAHAPALGRCRYGTRLGADNACGDSGCEPERIADGEYPFAYFQRVAVAKGYYRQPRCIYLDERKVGRGVGSDYGGVEGAVVVEGYFKPLGSVNHMVVGNNVAVCRYYHAAAESERLLFLLFRLLLGLLAVGIAEKEFEKRVGKTLSLLLGRARSGIAFYTDNSVY